MPAPALTSNGRLRFAAVVGAASASDSVARTARDVGAAIARTGCGLVCGGRGGVMEEACAGARDVLGAGTGRVVGILMSDGFEQANPHLDIAIPTGMGNARNVLVVLAADAVVAVGGEAGTLSELAFAWKLGRPVCAVASSGGWAERLAGTAIDGRRIDTVHRAATAADVEPWLRSALRLA
jgi:uncharacterized protein (TIGR00725 family)